MTEQDLAAIKAAMEQLRATSIHVIHIMNNMGDQQA